MSRRRRRGDGSVFFHRGSGLWAVAVRAPGGRRLWRYARTKAEAEALAAELTSRPDRMISPVTVGDWLAEWLAAKRESVRPSTWVSYEGHVRMHLSRLAPVRLGDLTAAHVRRLLRDLLDEGLSPRTVAYSLTILRMALGLAVRDGLLERNVAALVEAPRVRRSEPRVWDADQVRAFLTATQGDRWWPLWVVLVGTGVRLGEALGLRWRDVDLDTGVARITGSLRPIHWSFRGAGPRLVRVEPKSPSGQRTIVLPDFVRNALARIPRPDPAPIDGLIFVSEAGQPLDPRNVARAWEAAIRKTGLPRIRLHDLRHTSVSLLLDAGRQLDDVRRWAGHSKIALTSDTYGHLLSSRMEELAATMDRLVRL